MRSRSAFARKIPIVGRRLPTTTPDDEAKTLCRACPRRWLCARDAVESAGAEGLWAGVVIPESGRARAFALGQLRSLAERNGYPVRDHRVSAQSA